MHMADALLAPTVAAVMYVASGTAAGVSVHKLRKDDETQNDASSEVYKYIQCAVCPVKQTKANLHYVAEEKSFHDGGMTHVICAPELGFMFPAFDNRATNIYNALFYTHSPKQDHKTVIYTLFCLPAPMAAEDQKKSFEALLTTALDDECSMEVVQNIHDDICQSIELHKETKSAEPLLISKEQVKIHCPKAVCQKPKLQNLV